MLPLDRQERKERPMARGCLDYFPDALAYVSHVSFIGNKQHNPGEEMHWAREKSSDHADCIVRHLAERGKADDDNLLHSGKIAWRALALLQLEIEEGHKMHSNGVPIEYQAELDPPAETVSGWQPVEDTACLCPVCFEDTSCQLVIRSSDGTPVAASCSRVSEGAIASIHGGYLHQPELPDDWESARVGCTTSTDPNLRHLEFNFEDAIRDTIKFLHESTTRQQKQQEREAFLKELSDPGLPDGFEQYLQPRPAVSDPNILILEPAPLEALPEFEEITAPGFDFATRDVTLPDDYYQAIDPDGGEDDESLPDPVPLERLDQRALEDHITANTGCDDMTAELLSRSARVHPDCEERIGDVYIAGPMRGIPNFNFPAFDEAARQWAAEGYCVFSPADIDREAGFDPDVDDANTPADFVKRDTAIIRFLQANAGDLLVVLPGWEKSVGAAAEVFLARWLGIPIRDVDGDPIEEFGALDVINGLYDYFDTV